MRCAILPGPLSLLAFVRLKNDVVPYRTVLLVCVEKTLVLYGSLL